MSCRVSPVAPSFVGDNYLAKHRTSQSPQHIDGPAAYRRVTWVNQMAEFDAVVLPLRPRSRSHHRNVGLLCPF